MFVGKVLVDRALGSYSGSLSQGLRVIRKMTTIEQLKHRKVCFV